MSMTQTSNSWSFDKNDIAHSAKVLGWSVSASFVSFLIAILANANVPLKYAALVPVVNTLLVVVQRLIQSKQEE